MGGVGVRGVGESKGYEGKAGGLRGAEGGQRA